LRGMHGRAQTRLALELDEGHMRQALEFFDSTLGRKIVQIETNASSPASVAAMQGGLPVMQLSPERRALIDRLASQLPALEMGVEVSTALTGLAAQSANDLLGGLLGTAQAASDGGRERLRQQMRPELPNTLAYIYRDLSDAELTRFAAWSESAAGRALYRAPERAVQDALNPCSTPAVSPGDTAAPSSVPQTLAQPIQIALAEVGLLIGQVVPGIGQVEQFRIVELVLQNTDIVLPVHGAIGLALHYQRPVVSRDRRLDVRNPLVQRLHPGHWQHLRLQRVALTDEGEKFLGRGVVSEAPPQLLNEAAEQFQTELGNAPLPRTYQGRHEDGAPALLGDLPVQQTVNENGTAGTLAQIVPGSGQFPQPRMLDHAIQHLLIAQETVDTGPLATRQTMPRQIEGEHRQTLLQRPADHVPVESH